MLLDNTIFLKCKKYRLETTDSNSMQAKDCRQQLWHLIAAEDVKFAKGDKIEKLLNSDFGRLQKKNNAIQAL